MTFKKVMFEVREDKMSFASHL